MTDLISRQAALEMLNDNELERQADDVFDGDLHRYKRAAQRIIAQLPSAEKHGKWVLITNNYIDPQEYMCSVCGRTIKHYGIPELLLERYPYCNCGARMERSEE